MKLLRRASCVDIEGEVEVNAPPPGSGGSSGSSGGTANDESVNLGTFRDLNMATGAMMAIGFSFLVVCGVVVCIQLGGCLDRRKGIAKALNCVFASVGSKKIFKNCLPLVNLKVLVVRRPLEN